MALEGQRFNDQCRPIPSAHSPSGDRIGTRSQSGSKALSAEITHLTCALATGEEAFASFSELVEDDSPKDDSESPATRLSFPCVLQDSGCLDVGMLAGGGGWEEMWVPSHAPTQLPSCLSPALAEPIPSPVLLTPAVQPETSPFLPP